MRVALSSAHREGGRLPSDGIPEKVEYVADASRGTLESLFIQQSFHWRTMPRKRGRPRKASESVIPKDVLAKEIARIIDEREMTQTEAAWLVKDAPSQISLMVTGKTRGFAAERLIRTLTRLGRDVDMVLRKRKNGGTGKVSVSIKR